MFLKLPRSSAPPGGPVIRPQATQAPRLRDRARARDGPDNDEIAGYAVANDVSARDLQRSEKQWTRAKGFDTSLPLGPVDHDRRGPEQPRASRPTSTASSVRTATRSDLIFKPDELVAFIAETCTLEPGAIILTGTPSGVGEAFDPPRYLQPGDVVRCEVEGLGALEHSISEIR